jgi:homocysteine S-methyltransferase
MTIGDMPEGKGVFEVNSVGLLHAIEKLNSGVDLAGNELKGVPSFAPGVVCNPNAKNSGAEVRRLQKKRDAGASYALTQPVFDVEVAVRFLQEAAGVGIPILLGLLPFKTLQGVKNLSNVPGIRFPDALLAMLEGRAGEDLTEVSFRHCLEIAHAARPYVAGFHVVSGTTPKLALAFISQVRAAFSS